jgi:hypothetical protein
VQHIIEHLLFVVHECTRLVLLSNVWFLLNWATRQDYKLSMALHERPSKLTQSEDNDGVAELDELITLREVRASFNKVKVAIKLCPVPGTLSISR